MSSPKKPTALITGASRGIGYELTKIFAREGYNLVLVARDKAKLLEVANEMKSAHGSIVHIMVKDLTKTAAAQEIVAALKNEGITIEALVNNAGVGLFGDFTSTNLNDELDMIQINIITLTALTKYLLRDMVRKNHGKILNVASIAAFQPGPLMAVYYATKAYVLSFSEALANELKGTNITLTTLCPGPTESEFQARAGMESSAIFENAASAKEVAEAGYDGLMHNKSVVVPGKKNRTMLFCERFLPRKFITAFVRRAQDRRATFISPPKEKK